MKRKGARPEKRVDKDSKEKDSAEENNAESDTIENRSDEDSVNEQEASAGKKKKGSKTKRGRKSAKHDGSDNENDPRKISKRRSAAKKLSKKGGSEDEDDQEDPEENGDIHEIKSKKGAKGDDSEKKKKDSRKSSGKKSKKNEDDDNFEEEHLEDDLEDSEPEQKKSKKGKKNDESEDEEGDVEYEVEKVIGERTIKGHHQYLIRWKGYGPKGDTWEQESTLNCQDMIKEFHESDDADATQKKTSKSKLHEKKSAIKEQEVDWSSDDEFEVERILEVHFKRNGKREFLVSWKGYPSSQDSWEPEENLDCSELITKFMDKVNAARVVDTKDLRIKRAQTERFTLQMDARARRLSRRLGSKQRVHYHDAE